MSKHVSRPGSEIFPNVESISADRHQKTQRITMANNAVTKKLADRIAVITGGNSGMGLATARRFVAEGAYVFITGRRQKELDAAVKEIGSNVTGVRLMIDDGFNA
jgi:hypothetical protein